ncbi:MAG: 3-isopropylmalate dehydratase small subunit [Euryarchaeota archaeon]|nr:3-isopropylmalate dehydratase small subunit [Euryarchaeota archaeon]
MPGHLAGRAHVYGHNVDTDVLYPGRYLMVTDTAEMALHAAEDLDPEFRARVQEGDIFVAGRNLGCGSSREQAVVALKSAGIRALVCASAARIFFRNAINQGLPILRVGDAYDEIAERVSTGDPLEVDLATGIITHPATGSHWQAEALPPFLRELLDSGGLLPHLKRRIEAQKAAQAAVVTSGGTSDGNA